MKQFYILIFCLVFSTLAFSQSYQYTVQSIPYQEFQEQNIIQYNQDDIYSNVVNLPFAFDFYNLSAQTQLVVGSNGDVVFDTFFANAYDDWNIAEDDYIPNESLPSPAILGVFHDMDNRQSSAGGVYYGVSGETPNRRFYIFYEDIPHYQCTSIYTTSQIVLHEASGIIDVSIKNKPICETWNGGRAVLGLNMVDSSTYGIAAPERNTGQWEASEEAWRFKPSTNFNVVLCDINNDETEMFNVDGYKNELLSLFNLDPNTNTVNILDSTNSPVSGDVALGSGNNSFTIILNPGTNEAIFDLYASFINCDNDDEIDGIPNGMEDVNGNGNLADDDTDGDGIPNYLDDDDDGDTAISEYEIVFGGRSGNMTNPPTFLDTDNDGIYNHLDMDDDGDGVITMDEDYNGNGDPTDDDLNGNNIPDYLDATVLNIESVSLNSTLFSVYPNPANEILNVQFLSQINFSETPVELKVIDLQGRQVIIVQHDLLDNKTQLDISNLSAGHYLLVIKKDGLIKAKKFIVE